MIIRIVSIFLLLSSMVWANELIRDELVETTLDKSLRPLSYVQKVYKDELVETTLDKSLKPKPYNQIFYRDKLAEKTLFGKSFQKPVPNLNYDYSDDSYTSVKLRPKVRISTNGKSKLSDGDIVKFIVVENVFYNGKVILNKNSEVSAVVENISPNDRYGVPASLVLSRFSSELLPEKTLDGEIDRHGKNHSLWVYPLSYFLMPFFGAGLGTTFIRGGNVKINTDEVVEIYYRPTRFRSGL